MRQNRVYFIAGCSPRKGLFGVAAYLHELEEEEGEFTRFYMTLDTQWVNREFEADIVSVSYTKVNDMASWWLLSKRGVVISSSSRGRFEETIQDAGTGPGKFGYLSQIANVQGTLYAVGLGRQIYRREDSGWLPIDGGIRIESSRVGFKAIDGLARNSLHAVGFGGEIWYSDGERWRMADSPTNVILESVREISPGLCYACGKSGVVLRGYRDSWTQIDTAISDTFWSVQNFRDDVYFSTAESLYIAEGNNLVPLDLGRKVEGRRLYSNGDELWSMEHHELWRFDGSEWSERICLDNA